MKFPDHRRQDVRALKIEIVARPVQIRRHRRDEIAAVLPAIRLAQLDAGDFGNRVRLVGRLEPAGEQILLRSSAADTRADRCTNCPDTAAAARQTDAPHGPRSRESSCCRTGTRRDGSSWPEYRRRFPRRETHIPGDSLETSSSPPPDPSDRAGLSSRSADCRTRLHRSRRTIAEPTSPRCPATKIRASSMKFHCLPRDRTGYCFRAGEIVQLERSLHRWPRWSLFQNKDHLSEHTIPARYRRRIFRPPRQLPPPRS